MEQQQLDIHAAMALIERHEGRRNRVYKDSKGIDTIAIGFNLLAAGAKKLIESMDIDYEKLLAGTITLTEVQIDQLFAHSFATAVQTVKKIVPFFEDVPAPGQIALVDMAYNMGYGLAEFKKAIRLMESEHYIESAAEFMNSAWYHEVPNRAIDDKRLIEQCEPGRPELTEEVPSEIN